jgi:hypothetical protein
MHTGGSHDQEQDSEYDTRISCTREVRAHDLRNEVVQSSGRGEK